MQQCMELTVTNRSRAYPGRVYGWFGRYEDDSICGFEGMLIPEWPGGSAGQSAALSRQRSWV